jgi:hypothetical protein
MSGRGRLPTASTSGLAVGNISGSATSTCPAGSTAVGATISLTETGGAVGGDHNSSRPASSQWSADAVVIKAGTGSTTVTITVTALCV